MLLQEEVKVIESYGVEKAVPHKCSVFGPLQRGGFENRTEKIKYKYFPTQLNVLKGRQKELFDLINNVCSGERLI